MANNDNFEEKITREQFLEDIDSMTRGELEDVAREIYEIANPEDLTRGDIIDMIMEIYDLEGGIQ
jgi:hypothetical protein